MSHPKVLALNEILDGRKHGERLKPTTVEEFDHVELCGPPKNWADAPGMPYTKGLRTPRKEIHRLPWTPAEKKAVMAAHRRGDVKTVNRMIKEKQSGY